MNELKAIWSSNTAWQNMCWLANIALFFVILPYIIIKVLWSKE